MGLRQKEWAAKTWKRIVKDLGGKCAQCGTRRKLTLDCISPRGHRHHQLEWSWRISFYRHELEIGNLQVLCKRHNEMKGNR